jgi:hypothetical protein
MGTLISFPPRFRAKSETRTLANALGVGTTFWDPFGSSIFDILLHFRDLFVLDDRRYRRDHDRAIIHIQTDKQNRLSTSHNILMRLFITSAENDLVETTSQKGWRHFSKLPVEDNTPKDMQNWNWSA